MAFNYYWKAHRYTRSYS